jgi:radical SAM PhpK family P-methyltransferase
MIDALIVGYNDPDFGSFVDSVRSLGVQSGAYKDLSLAFLNHNGRPYRALDLLSYCRDGQAAHPRFHNVDFLWPTITYLGSYLHRHGLSFDYVNLFQREKDKLIAKLGKGDVRTVAITTTLYVTPQPIIEIIELVRRHAPATKIVVGGPFVGNQTTSLDERSVMALFRYLGADFYIDSNEGEAAFVALLRALRDGTDLAAVPNLSFRSGEGYVRNKRETERNELSENLVNYALFPREDIGQFVSLRTAKSCPFSCAFCGFPQRAGKYLYNVTDTVERELDTIRELGTVTTLTFLDDTFNVPKKRFKEILNLMARKNYGFRWNSFYRSDHGDPETIEMMAAAGCEGVFLGIESGSDKQLERMKKTSRRRHYLDAIPRFRAAGISTYASIIVGFPGETADTVAESADLIETAAPDFFRAQLWYADPITPIWERRAEFGVTGEAFNWAHDTMTSAEACRHIDHLFMSIRNSVWMPQNGFEQWSTFYLQRHGYTLDQIKRFLGAFNDGIKEKILFGDDVEASPGVLKRLQACSDPQNRQLPSRSPFDPADYTAAVTAWTRAIGPQWPSSKRFQAVAPVTDGDRMWTTVVCPVGRDVLDRTGTGEVEVGASWLTVLAIALGRLDGDGRVPVLAGLEAGEGPVPMPVAIDETAGFMDAARDAASAYRTARSAGAYGTFPIRNLYAGGPDAEPKVEVGMRIVSDAADPSPIPDGLWLVLELRTDQVALACDGQALDTAGLAALAAYVARLAKDVSLDPLARIETLGVDRKVAVAAREEAAATFNF